MLRFVVLALLAIIASVAAPGPATKLTAAIDGSMAVAVRLAASSDQQEWRDGTELPVDLDALENDVDDDDDDDDDVDGHKHAALKHAAKEIALPSSRAVSSAPHVRSFSDSSRFTTSPGFPRGPPRA